MGFTAYNFCLHSSWSYLSFASKGLAGDEKGAIHDIEIFLKSSSRPRNLDFPAIAALLFFHSCLPERNHQLIEDLHSKLSASERLACSDGVLFASQFSYFVDNFANAKRLLTRIAAQRGSDLDYRVQIHGAWIYFSSDIGEYCLDRFDGEHHDAHLIRTLWVASKYQH